MEDLVKRITNGDTSDDSCLEYFSKNFSTKNKDVNVSKKKEEVLSYSFTCKNKLSTSPSEGQDMEELEGHTILHLAVCYKKYKTAEAIAEDFRDLIQMDVGKYPDNKERYLGLTPLHIAIAHGNIDLVTTMTKFLEKGVLQSLLKGDYNFSQIHTKTPQADTSKSSNIRRCAVGCESTRKRDGICGVFIGSRMKGTVFMGKLPLTVALLSDISNHPETDDHPMVELLAKIMKEEDIQITLTNNLKDTVFHSIIRYVTCFPADEDRAAELMKWIIDNHILLAEPVNHDKTVSVEPKGQMENNKSQSDGPVLQNIQSDEQNNPDETVSKEEDSLQIQNNEKDYKNLNQANQRKLVKFLSKRNNDGKTAFQLATESGHVKLYSRLLGLCCLKEPHDGIYQIGCYDITEIEKQFQTPENSDSESSKSPTIAELICSQPLSIAIQMISEDVFDKFISQKWEKYRKMFFPLFLIHCSLMVLMCFYVAERAHVTVVWSLSSRFFKVCFVMFIIVALIYIVQECVRSVFAKQILAWTAFHHNVVFRFLTWVFSICLLIDSILWLAGCKVNFFLLFALLSGTWNMMFFLRAIPYFGVYIVLINEALIKAVFPFAVLALIQLFVFSVSLHSVFLQPDNAMQPIQNFETFGVSLVSMGKLMVGITEFDFLLNAKEDYLAVILFVFFILVTFLLMLNALIGVMTNRFTDPQHDRLKVEYLQKLSIIIYLEGWFVGCLQRFAFQAGKVDSSGERYVLSYKRVPSNQADNPTGIEHRLKKEFKRTTDTMQDLNERLSTLEKETGKVLNILRKRTDTKVTILKEVQIDQIQTFLAKQEETLKSFQTQFDHQVQEMMNCIQRIGSGGCESTDDRQRRLLIYHYEK